MTENKVEWPVEAVKNVENLYVAETELLIRRCDPEDESEGGIVLPDGSKELVDVGVILRGSDFDVGGQTIGVGDAVAFGGFALSIVGGIGKREDRDKKKIGLLTKKDVKAAMVKS